jgi:L-fuculose-phosphate aldolase
MPNEQAVRREVVDICRWMYERKYIASTDGNVSVRLTNSTLLVTPSGIPKGHLKPDQLVVTDLNGKVIRGSGKPSSELKMHLKVYEVREDVNAVVHAHPAVCLGFSVAGKSLSIPALTEVVLSLGDIPIAPYATPTTVEVPEAIGDLIKKHNALIMDRHGSITVGTTLMQAYNILETIEHAAEVLLYATQLGGIRPLPAEEAERLADLGRDLGLRSDKKSKQKNLEEDPLLKKVVAEVIKQLQGSS